VGNESKPYGGDSRRLRGSVAVGFGTVAVVSAANVRGHHIVSLDGGDVSICSSDGLLDHADYLVDGASDGLPSTSVEAKDAFVELVRSDAEALVGQVLRQRTASEEEIRALVRPMRVLELNEVRLESYRGSAQAFGSDVEGDGVLEALVLVRRLEAGYAVEDAFRCEATLTPDMARLRDIVEATREGTR